jgi:flagellar biosynthesis chaperone FliJ
VKRFQFRLERVLRLKEQRKRMAELRQQRARLALEAARGKALAIAAELAQTAAVLQGRLGRPVAMDAWLTAYAHSTRLGRALQAAEAEVHDAEKGLRQADAERTRVATEVEALLHLRREAWEEHSEAARNKEQERLDELGMRRWKANQDGDGPPAPGS